MPKVSFKTPYSMKTFSFNILDILEALDEGSYINLVAEWIEEQTAKLKKYKEAVKDEIREIEIKLLELE